MKIGRNDPCPCGSGKKSKRCCLDRPPETPLLQPATVHLDEDELDDLSNRAIDLIDAGRFDEAEALCQALLRRYPDEVDGLERMAMVWEARGDKAQAQDYFRKALSFATLTGRVDPDSVTWYKEQIAKQIT